jgi:hypothetical protein
MPIFSVGDHLKKSEDINTEYKLFCFLCSQKQAYLHLLNGEKQKFLQIAKQNIILYLDKYIPKYFASFYNSKHVDNGELIIGISDYGEIVGIPCIPSLSEQQIKDYAMFIIYKTLRVQFHNSKSMADAIYNSIKKYINVNVIPIDNQENDYNMDAFIDYETKKLKKYIRLEEEYKVKKEKWVADLHSYKRGIDEMMNDKEVVQDIIRFVIEHDPFTNQSLFVNTLTNWNKFNINKIKLEVISHLLDEEKVELDQVEVRKHDITEVDYWITKYRDIKQLQMLKTKPKYHGRRVPADMYIGLFNNFHLLFGTLARLGVKMCIVHISLPSGAKKTIKHPNIGYYKNGRWHSPVRQFDVNNGPCCM